MDICSTGKVQGDVGKKCGTAELVGGGSMWGIDGRTFLRATISNWKALFSCAGASIEAGVDDAVQ